MSKMKTKCFSKRVLALLLTLVLAIGVLPTAALANGGDNTTPAPVEIPEQTLLLELTASGSGSQISGDNLVHDSDLSEYGLVYTTTLDMSAIGTLYTALKMIADEGTNIYSDYVGFSGTMETVLKLPKDAVIADKYKDSETLKNAASQVLATNTGFDTFYQVDSATLAGNEITVTFSFKQNVTGKTIADNNGMPSSLTFPIPDDMLTLSQEKYVDGGTLTTTATLTGKIEINIPDDPENKGAHYQTAIRNKINTYRKLFSDLSKIFPNDITNPVSQLVVPVKADAENTLQMKIPAYVTFKVVNGTWKDGTTDDIKVKVDLTNGEGTLAVADVPTGMIPGEGTSGVQGWDAEPMTLPNMITQDITYTYTFVPEQYTVTYKTDVAGETPLVDTVKKGSFIYEVLDYEGVASLFGWTVPEGKVFDHWKGSDGKQYAAKEAILNLSESLELTAVYKEPVTYTVTFKPGSDGKFKDSTETEIKEDNIKLGGTLSNPVPEILAEGGKIFIGWENGVNGGLYTSEDVKDYVITEDITFTAQYVDGKSVVIFNFAGGANEAGESYEVVTGVSGGSLNGTPTDVTWYGQQPIGWTDEKGKTVELTDVAFGDNGTVTTYYAKWEVEVTFAIEGGTWNDADSAPKTEIVELTKGVGTLNMDIPTGMQPSDGFSSIGDWDIAPMQTILGILTGNKITFTYKFVPTDYKVTYNPGEGTGTAQSDSTAQDAPYEIWGYAILSDLFGWAPPADKEFSHWEDKTGTSYDAEQLLLGGPEGDLELTAVYKNAATATVTFKVVNGTWANGTTDDIEVKVVLINGEGTLAVADVPTGMIPDPGTSGVQGWDAEPMTLPNMITQDITYTYTFVPEQYTVTYKTDVAGETPLVDTVKKDSFIYEVLDYEGVASLFGWTVPEGKVFDHWKGSDGKQYAAKEAIQNLSESLELTAVYKEPVTYAVTFKPGSDGKFKDSTETEIAYSNIKPGDTVPNVPGITANNNYTFLGWTKDGGTTKYSSADILTMQITENTTFTAAYQRTTVINSGGGGGGGGGTTNYSLSFQENGGTAIQPISEASGTTIDLSKYVPTRQGYKFDGWCTDKGLTNIATSVKLTGNMVVYAKWTLLAPLNTEDHVAYVAGYTDGTVRPNANVTRAETTMMLYRLLTNERRTEIETTRNSFSDVNSSMWYNSAVSTMANGGYISGYSDGTFGGEKTITRAEFVTMLVRFIGVDNSASASFTDISRNHWAYQYIATAANNGWVSGYSNGTFGGDQAITRAEAMAIINRVLGRGVDADSELLNYRQFPDNSDPHAWYYYEVIEASNTHEYTGSRPSEDWTSISK